LRRRSVPGTVDGGRCRRRATDGGRFASLHGAKEEAGRSRPGGGWPPLEDRGLGWARCSVGGRSPKRCSGHQHGHDTGASAWDEVKLHDTRMGCRWRKPRAAVSDRERGR
jgi:hypothetical protein